MNSSLGISFQLHLETLAIAAPILPHSLVEVGVFGDEGPGVGGSGVGVMAF